MYLDQALQTYLDDLASAKSTPGGGSTAALSGAMAAALVCMVTRLTLGKADYAEVQVEIETIIQQSEQLRERFQQLIQADIEAYGQLAASFKLSRGTAEEKVARTQAIQAQLAAAALVPLEMVEAAAELAQYTLRVAQIGNKNVLSDIGTAISQVSSAAMGASWMVRVNLQSMKDVEHAEELNNRLDIALETVMNLNLQVVNTLGERV